MRCFVGVVLLTGSLLLSGCQSAIVSMPVPSGSASTVGPNASDPGDLTPPAGATDISTLGDPCALLTRSEVAKALKVAVLAVARGKLHSDGGQVCSYAMDAPGSTAAALGGFVGTLGSSDPAKVIDALGSSRGVFGVVLQPGESASSADTSGDSAAPPPGVTFKKLQIGAGGVVIATPNGGAAIAADGIRTRLMLMNLIAGPADPAALETLLTTAYSRL